MAKIITAFRDRQTARQIAAALEASGLSVFRVCATGNEVMRAFNQCSDGILVCGTAFADRTVDSLCEDLGERALVLAVGRPENLDNCECPALFRLTSPFSRSELIASVNMLAQRRGSRAGGARQAQAHARAAAHRGSGAPPASVREHAPWRQDDRKRTPRAG